MCALIRCFRFMGTKIFKTHVYCLVGCLGTIVLDTCCFGCLICTCFIFLYLHLLSAVQHVSHGKAL